MDRAEDLWGYIPGRYCVMSTVVKANYLRGSSRWRAILLTITIILALSPFNVKAALISLQSTDDLRNYGFIFGNFNLTDRGVALCQAFVNQSPFQDSVNSYLVIQGSEAGIFLLGLYQHQHQQHQSCLSPVAPQPFYAPPHPSAGGMQYFQPYQYSPYYVQAPSGGGVPRVPGLYPGYQGYPTGASYIAGAGYRYQVHGQAGAETHYGASFQPPHLNPHGEQSAAGYFDSVQPGLAQQQNVAVTISPSTTTQQLIEVEPQAGMIQEVVEEVQADNNQEGGSSTASGESTQRSMENSPTTVITPALPKKTEIDDLKTLDQQKEPAHTTTEECRSTETSIKPDIEITPTLSETVSQENQSSLPAVEISTKAVTTESQMEVISTISTRLLMSDTATTEVIIKPTFTLKTDYAVKTMPDHQEGISSAKTVSESVTEKISPPLAPMTSTSDVLIQPQTTVVQAAPLRRPTTSAVTRRKKPVRTPFPVESTTINPSKQVRTPFPVESTTINPSKQTSKREMKTAAAVTPSSSRVKKKPVKQTMEILSTQSGKTVEPDNQPNNRPNKSKRIRRSGKREIKTIELTSEAPSEIPQNSHQETPVISSTPLAKFQPEIQNEPDKESNREKTVKRSAEKKDKTTKLNSKDSHSETLPKQKKEVETITPELVHQTRRTNPFVALFIQPVQRVCGRAKDGGRKWFSGKLVRIKKWLPLSKTGKVVKKASKAFRPPTALLRQKGGRVRGYRSNPLYVMVKFVFLNMAIYGSYWGWRWASAGEEEADLSPLSLLPEPPSCKPHVFDEEVEKEFDECPVEMQPDIVRMSCNQAVKAGKYDAARLLAVMGMKPANHYYYPATGIVNTLSQNQIIREIETDRWNCSGLEYFQVGYVPLGKEMGYSPIYPLKADELFFLLTEAAEILAEHGIRDEGSSSLLDRALIWCGFPVVESAKAPRRQCISRFAEMILNDDKWFEQPINQLYFRMYSGATVLDETHAHLGFQPAYKLGQNCRLAEYEYFPRIVTPEPVSHRFIDRFLTSPSGWSSSMTDIELPEYYSLEMQAANTSWVWDGINRTRFSSLDDLEDPGTYRLSVPDKNVKCFLSLHNGRPLLSPPDSVGQPENRSGIDWGRHLSHAPEKIIPPQSVRAEKNYSWISLSTYISVPALALINLMYLYHLYHGEGLWSGILLTMVTSVELGLHHNEVRVSKSYYTPPQDPESDVLIRQEGFSNLQSYFIITGEFDKANMISVLAMDTLPLGVIKFRKEQGVFYPLRYSSLFSFPGDQQLQLFNQAYKGCVSMYSECHSANRDHIEYLRFHMMVCADITVRQCGKMWQDKVASRAKWKLLVNTLDWPEKGLNIDQIHTPFQHFLSQPVLIKEGKVVKFQVLVHAKHFGVPPSPPKVLVNGHHYCGVSNECLRSSDGGFPEGRFTLVSPVESSTTIFLQGVSPLQPVQMLAFANRGLLVPYWNRGKSWLADNVSVYHEFEKDCSAMRNDNLRIVCAGLSDYEKEQWMEDIFYLNRIFSPEDLVPVYRTRWLSRGEDKSELDIQIYPERIRATFMDISPERIRNHLQLLDRFPNIRKHDPGGGSLLLHAGIFYETEGCPEPFLNSSGGLGYKNANDLYRIFYREVDEKPELLTSPFGQCFRKHLRQGDLENSERHFLLHTLILKKKTFRVEYLPEGVSFAEEDHEEGVTLERDIYLGCYSPGYHLVSFGGPERVQIVGEYSGVDEGCSDSLPLRYGVRLEKEEGGMMVQKETGYYDLFIGGEDEIYHEHCYPDYLYQMGNRQ